MRERPELSTLVPNLSVMVKANRQRVAILRNATEHLETRLLKGTISEGDYVMLSLSNDACELERCSIAYAELAGWLTEIHAGKPFASEQGRVGKA